MSDRIEAIIAALRKKLLDAAVRGELVDQDNGEEPASALLERIAAERSRLIREKKIKKPKSSSRIERRDGHFYESVDGSTPVCIDDELPFEIPDSWEWVRLPCLLSVCTGKRDVNFGSQNGAYPFFTCGKEPVKCSSYSFSGDAILVAGNGDIANVSYFSGNFEAYQRTYVLQPYISGYLKYIYYHILSNWVEYNKEKMYGSTIPYIRLGNIQDYLVAVPPLHEQHRIVDALERQLKQLDILRESYRRMRRILHETPTSLRQQLLQAAIEGKLVAQDPKEEPASALLERIAKERAALPGKRKAAPQSRIERRPDGICEIFPDGSEKDISDEIPFDIPERWEWVRLESVCTYIQRGKSPKYSEIAKIPVISQKCIQWSGFTIEKARFIDPESLSCYNKERFLEDGDLLLNSTGTGTIGRMAIYMSDLNPYGVALADGHVTVVRPYKDLVLNRFICTLFASPQIQSQIEKKSDGSTNQIEFSLSKVKETLVPLPPLQEQQRIVQQLEELLPLVSQA